MYGFCGDCEQNKERRQKETEIGIEGQKEIIDTYSNDTQGWKEAQMKYGKLKRIISKETWSKYGVEGIRGKLGNWDEDRQAALKTNELRQSAVHRIFRELWEVG